MRADGHAVHMYAECLASWMRGDLAYTMPGGHSGNAFVSRFEDAIRRIVSDHDGTGSVVIFGHGAAIRVYTAVRAGLDPAVAIELRIANTGLAVLEGDLDTGWTLERWTTVPLGGPELEDARAHDVTGESVEEAVLEGD